MSLPDVCSLWIEQRISEEKDTGKSLREIGRIIAQEVEKHFEVKVNPVTIFSKARRAVADSNESPAESDEISTHNAELEKLEKTQHGGARQGSGRKPANNQLAASDDYSAEEQEAIASGEIFDGQRFATMAIEQLRRIKKDDPDRVAALIRVKEWINNNLNS